MRPGQDERKALMYACLEMIGNAGKRGAPLPDVPTLKDAGRLIAASSEALDYEVKGQVGRELFDLGYRLRSSSVASAFLVWHWSSLPCSEEFYRLVDGEHVHFGWGSTESLEDATHRHDLWGRETTDQIWRDLFTLSEEERALASFASLGLG